jgi:hypothetical protein
LRYIAGIMDYGLDYVRGDGVRLIGYTELDWAGCEVDSVEIWVPWKVVPLSY